MTEFSPYAELPSHRILNILQLVAWGIDCLSDPETHKELEKVIQDHCRPPGERPRYWWKGLEEDGRSADDICDWGSIPLMDMVRIFVTASSHEEAIKMAAAWRKEDREKEAEMRALYPQLFECEPRVSA